MPHIRRLLETSLYCDDVAVTTGFYARLLERPPMMASDRVVAFDAGGGTVLLLFQRGACARPIRLAGGVVPGHDGAGPTHLAFAIDTGDLAAWEDRLTALGIAVESRVEWTGGGRSLYFRDPDGRSVELATPGTWPSY